jgi:Mlc titration factor MtfA (ptsG expression regulator)
VGCPLPAPGLLQELPAAGPAPAGSRGIALLFRRLRRARILRQRLLVPEHWASLLEEHPILGGLGPEELGRLRELSTLFLHEKIFELRGGQELDQYRRSVIAVQACLPVLNLGLDWYRNWGTIVVVPDVFTQELREQDEAGVVHEWEEEQSGEAWDQGPVVLSWQDVEASGWGDGYNVVIHEAAHKLDLLDGQSNGRPQLHEGVSAAEWYEGFAGAYEDFRQRASRKSKGRRLRIDDYAAENDAEFFAVACEYFFEQPGVLKEEYPQVYRLLAAFFRQDPASRLAARTPRKRGN